MDFWVIVATAFALSMDAFAVTAGISCGISRVFLSQALRLAFTFGGFQTLMAIMGFYAGSFLSAYIGIFDHWIAFGILLFLGIKMIKEAKEAESCEKEQEIDPTKGIPLLGLGIATSIDSLAVGAGFGIVGLSSIFFPATLIGIITFGMTGVGFYLGRILRLYLRKWAELAGGVALILIGLKILLEGLGVPL